MVIYAASVLVGVGGGSVLMADPLSPSSTTRKINNSVGHLGGVQIAAEFSLTFVQSFGYRRLHLGKDGCAIFGVEAQSGSERLHVRRDRNWTL